MDTQDKIINKIKAAAHKTEQQDFAAMDKVWARIDQKLDQQALQTKTKIWKKMAIAASVLLLLSLGYQVSKPFDEKITTNEVIVVNDSLKPKPETSIATTIDTAKITKVLKAPQATVAIIESKTANKSLDQAPQEEIMTAPATSNKERVFYKKENRIKSSGKFYSAPVYDAVETVAVYEKQKIKDTLPDPKTAAPLVVLNGKIIESSHFKSTKEAKRALMNKMEDDEVESLVVLKEPLYIINGVEYTEESLFGTKPTSPYAPLSSQKIESIQIFQDEEAVEKFGAKGKKGVVIISTKNGIPVKK